MKTIKCVVAGYDANGDPDFFFVKVRATDEQINETDHYLAAERWAEEEGCEGPFVTFDETDPPMRGRGFQDLFAWDTATVVTARSEGEASAS